MAMMVVKKQFHGQGGKVSAPSLGFLGRAVSTQPLHQETTSSIATSWLGLASSPLHHFDFAVFEGATGNNAVGNAHQVGILEFHPGPFVAVIQQGFYPNGLEAS
jgi:hypothetical protein